jgi:ribonuclease HI
MNLNLTPEKLAEKIVYHIWNELGALSGLGDIKFNMSKQDKNEQAKSWIEMTTRIIKEASNQRKYLGYFDGSAKPNPGEMTIGGYITNPDRKKMYSYSISIGHGTNNVAEYKSLINLLKECVDRGIQRVLIRGDSQLVINQIDGAWSCYEPKMIELRDEALELISKIDTRAPEIA